MLVETNLNWYEAEEYCHSKNAYLAELIEPQERDAVWNYARGNIWEHLRIYLYNFFLILPTPSLLCLIGLWLNQNAFVAW